MPLDRPNSPPPVVIDEPPLRQPSLLNYLGLLKDAALYNGEAWKGEDPSGGLLSAAVDSYFRGMQLFVWCICCACLLCSSGSAMVAAGHQAVGVVLSSPSSCCCCFIMLSPILMKMRRT